MNKCVLTRVQWRANAAQWVGLSPGRSAPCGGRGPSRRCGRHRWGAPRWPAAGAWSAPATACASACAAAVGPRPPSHWRPGWPAALPPSPAPPHRPSRGVTSRPPPPALNEPSNLCSSLNVSCLFPHNPVSWLYLYSVYIKTLLLENVPRARGVIVGVRSVHKNQLKMIRQLSMSLSAVLTSPFFPFGVTFECRV